MSDGELRDRVREGRAWAEQQIALSGLPWLCRSGHEHATRNEARACDGRPPVEEPVVPMPMPRRIKPERRESTPLALLPVPHGERPNFFETSEGSVVCAACRHKRLTADQTKVLHSEPETARDFTNLGRTPWAGNDEGDRYIQCDDCMGQWGPDA